MDVPDRLWPGRAHDRQTVQQQAEFCQTGQLRLARPGGTAAAGRGGAQLAATGRTAGATVVLLSPGGTSYDAYQDFEERGEHFRQLVRASARDDAGESEVGRTSLARLQIATSATRKQHDRRNDAPPSGATTGGCSPS